MKRPSNDDIMEVFFSRSAFFRYHAKLFPLVEKVPVVQKWLLGEEGVTDVEVWNFRKPTFENLKVVLDEHGAKAAESSKNVKSKGGEIEVKMKAKSKDEKKDGKKGKKKAKENDEGSEDGERSRRKGKWEVTENDGESDHGEKGGRKGKKKVAAKSKIRSTV